MTVVQRIKAISRRELAGYSRRPLFLFCMIVAPVFCAVFFVTLMDQGLPTGLPAGIVDEDNTNISRTIIRTIDAMEEARFTESYPSFTAAREAMQRGEIFSFFYIPEGTTEKALANRQPTISFYTNEAYFVPGSLLMKDFRTASELSGLALTRETLYAKGATEDRAMGIIQPVTIETHPINNPTLDYAVYLNNLLVPGILILLIMLSTSYTIGMEWKFGTQKRLYAMSGNSSTIALAGKLLPQTVLFTLMFVFYDVYFYRFMGYPCHVPIWHMMLARLHDRPGLAGVRRILFRSISRSDAHRHVPVLAMGNTVVLARRLHLSGHGNGSCAPASRMAVSAASLLPDLCQPGT